jgi:hypothetical protein
MYALLISMNQFQKRLKLLALNGKWCEYADGRLSASRFEPWPPAAEAAQGWRLKLEQGRRHRHGG